MVFLGLVTDLIDQHITRVALGKAHSVALNNKGQIFTFGLNNKGQCGRLKNKESSSSTSMESSDPTASTASALISKYDTSNMCDFEEHTVVHGQCRVIIIYKYVLLISIMNIYVFHSKRFVQYAKNVQVIMCHV